DLFAGRGFREKLGPAVLAQHIHALRPVVLRILVVTHAAAAQLRQAGAAVFKPSLDERRLVFAGIERAGDGCRRQGRALAAAGDGIGHAALGTRAVLKVLHSLVDDLLGDDDARVAAGTERLYLGDGDGALVKAAAVGAGHVAPAAPRRLGLAREVDGAGQDILQVAAALSVLLFAEDECQKEQGVAMVMHVAAAHAVERADETV